MWDLQQRRLRRRKSWQCVSEQLTLPRCNPFNLVHMHHGSSSNVFWSVIFDLFLAPVLWMFPPRTIWMFEIIPHRSHSYKTAALWYQYASFGRGKLPRTKISYQLRGLQKLADKVPHPHNSLLLREHRPVCPRSTLLFTYDPPLSCHLTGLAHQIHVTYVVCISSCPLKLSSSRATSHPALSRKKNMACSTGLVWWVFTPLVAGSKSWRIDKLQRNGLNQKCSCPFFAFSILDILLQLTCHIIIILFHNNKPVSRLELESFEEQMSVCPQLHHILAKQKQVLHFLGRNQVIGWALIFSDFENAVQWISKNQISGL